MDLTVSVSLVLWVVLGLFALTVLALTSRYIPNDRVGIVEKLWSPSGSVTHGIIALNGEAGFQPELGPNAFRGTLVALCAEWLMEQPNRIR